MPQVVKCSKCGKILYDSAKDVLYVNAESPEDKKGSEDKNHKPTPCPGGLYRGHKELKSPDEILSMYPECPKCGNPLSVQPKLIGVGVLDKETYEKFTAVKGATDAKDAKDVKNVNGAASQS